MASRKLEDLTQSTMQMAKEHVRLCKMRGIDLLVYCTLRPNAEQSEIYAVGRTKPGKILTNARAGESAHNPDDQGKASAYDAVPMLGGKPQWDSKSPLWAVAGACGEEAGLIWSGRWQGKLREQAHWQNPSWKKS